MPNQSVGDPPLSVPNHRLISRKTALILFFSSVPVCVQKWVSDGYGGGKKLVKQCTNKKENKCQKVQKTRPVTVRRNFYIFLHRQNRAYFDIMY